MVDDAGFRHMRRTLFDDDLADFEKIMAVDLPAVMAGDARRRAACANGSSRSIMSMASISGILQRRDDLPRVEGRHHPGSREDRLLSSSPTYGSVNAIAPGNIRTTIVRKAASGEDLGEG